MQTSPQDNLKTRRWPRILIVLGAALAALTFFLPTLLIETGMLVHLVNQGLVKHGLAIHIASPQIGWFRPMQLDDIEVVDQRNLWHVKAKQVRGDRTLGQWLWDYEDLGSFVLDSPTVTIKLGQPFDQHRRDLPVSDRQPSRRTQKFNMRLREGTILVQQPDAVAPQLLVDHINIEAHWATTPNSRTLVVDPGKPLQNVKLTPEMCDYGLKYAAPVFSNVAWTSGEMSLQLDRCDIPLHDPAAIAVAGRITLHSVETGLKNPLTMQIAKMASDVMQKELPKSTRIADGSVIEFQVLNQRVHHSGLAFGFPSLSPDFVVRTQGTVGFDKSLDLLAEIPLPTKLLGDRPAASLLGDQPLSLPIRGTLDQWEIDAGDGQLANQLLSKFLQSDSLQNIELDEVVDAVREMRKRAQERRDTSGPFLDRLRNRRSQNRAPASL